MKGSMLTFDSYDEAVKMWHECHRLGKGPHSIFWHEAEKMWAFWVL